MECQSHARPAPHAPRRAPQQPTLRHPLVDAGAGREGRGGAGGAGPGERAGRGRAGGGRWRPRGHRGRAPSRPAPRHGPARPAAPPAIRAAAGDLRAARPAAGKDSHRHLPPPLKVQFSWPAETRGSGMGVGTGAGTPAGTWREGKTTGGILGLGRKRFAEPRHPDRGSAERGALVVPWFSPTKVHLVGTSACS